MHTDSIRRAFMFVGIVTVAWLSLTLLIGGWWQFRAALARTDAADHWASIVQNVGTSARYMTGQSESASAARQASLARFTGGWAKHGSTLTIAPDGSAEASWRTYQWCKDPGVKPPCDSVHDDGEIAHGGYARILFTHADADTAYGTMLATNAPGAPTTPYPVQLTIVPDGVAVLLSGDALLLAPGQRQTIDGPVFCRVENWQREWCGA